MLKARAPSLAGKLLATSALVAVSLAYGWWQDRTGKPIAPASQPVAAPPSKPSTPEVLTLNPPAASAAPDANGPVVTETPLPPAHAAAQAAPPQKTASATMPPVARAPQAAPAPAQTQALVQPAPQAPAPAGASSGATVVMPAGTHLIDGDFISEEENFEWGVVQVKLSLHSGAITNVAILQIPDHRSRSVELSEVAAPILIRETLHDQTSKVDTVSEATYTSMAFQDAVANALMKATQ